jgi:alkylhydroperoxidase family enzyme
MSKSIVRLEMDQLEPSLAARLAPRVARLGYLGEFFKCAGHQPAALTAFVDFTEESKKGLPERLVEVVALSAALSLGNAYERNQHERLCVRRGFGKDWIAAVEALDPDHAPGLSDGERAVQRYVLRALEGMGRGAAAALEGLVEALGAEAAVAVMMVLGRYAVHGLIVNSLELAPPVPSVFEDGFEG